MHGRSGKGRSRRRPLVALVGAITAVIGLVSGTGPASASGMTVTLNLTQSDGVTVMAHAAVVVFYQTSAQSAAPVGTTIQMVTLASVIRQKFAQYILRGSRGSPRRFSSR